MRIRDFFELPKEELLEYLKTRYRRWDHLPDHNSKFEIFDILGLDKVPLENKLVKKNCLYQFYGIFRYDVNLVITMSGRNRVEIWIDLMYNKIEMSLFFVSMFDDNREHKVIINSISDAYRVLKTHNDYFKKLSKPD